MGSGRREMNIYRQVALLTHNELTLLTRAGRWSLCVCVCVCVCVYRQQRVDVSTWSSASSDDAFRSDRKEEIWPSVSSRMKQNDVKWSWICSGHISRTIRGINFIISFEVLMPSFWESPQKFPSRPSDTICRKHVLIMSTDTQRYISLDSRYVTICVYILNHQTQLY